MSTRIEQRFQQLNSEGRTGLVTFITAGDPEPGASGGLMHALVKGGADIIELGIPFSDPMADGPIIQRASERALAAGETLSRVLDSVAEFRRDDRTTPIVLMGYLNPIERMQVGEFARRACAAGVDGVLIVDLPPDEATEINHALRAVDLDQIFLIAPTSSLDRIDRVCDKASGFIYCVSVSGITGDKRLDVGEVGERIRYIRGRTRLPVGVGFGVKDPATAAAVGKLCDAVIVGSVLVEIVEKARRDVVSAAAELERFVLDLRKAIDAESVAA